MALSLECVRAEPEHSPTVSFGIEKEVVPDKSSSIFSGDVTAFIFSMLWLGMSIDRKPLCACTATLDLGDRELNFLTVFCMITFLANHCG